MGARKDFDDAELRRLWGTNMPARAIGKIMGASDTFIYARAAAMGLPHRPSRAVSRKPWHAPAPAPDIAPQNPLEARKDWPDIQAAIMRARTSTMPVKTVAIIAARHRLPVAVVQGLAAEVWG